MKVKNEFVQLVLDCGRYYTAHYAYESRRISDKFGVIGDLYAVIRYPIVKGISKRENFEFVGVYNENGDRI